MRRPAWLGREAPSLSPLTPLNFELLLQSAHALLLAEGLLFLMHLVRSAEVGLHSGETCVGPNSLFCSHFVRGASSQRKCERTKDRRQFLNTSSRYDNTNPRNSSAKKVKSGKVSFRSMMAWLKVTQSYETGVMHARTHGLELRLSIFLPKHFVDASTLRNSLSTLARRKGFSRKHQIRRISFFFCAIFLPHRSSGR